MTAALVAAQPIVNAVLEAVRAQDLPIGDSAAPAREGTKPWVVAWFDSGTLGPHTLASRDAWDITVTAHCLGLSAEAARIAAAKFAVAAQSLHRTTVAGRTFHIPEQITALPVSRDDDANPPIFDAVTEWRFRTSPA